jgi:hypothetical protein
MKHVIFGLAAALLVTSGAAFAQGPPGGMPPEIQKMMAGFQKYGKSPKGQLGTTMRALAEFPGDPKTRFTKPQAAAILKIINAWKSKPSMSQDEGGKVNKQITATFSIPQIKKQAQIGAQGFGGGGGGGRPGGGGMGGRPGGGGPGGGGGFDPKRMADMVKRMETMNPFNPGSMPENPRKAQLVERFNKMVSDLQAAAK